MKIKAMKKLKLLKYDSKLEIKKYNTDMVVQEDYAQDLV